VARLRQFCTQEAALELKAEPLAPDLGLWSRAKEYAAGASPAGEKLYRKLAAKGFEVLNGDVLRFQKSDLKPLALLRTAASTVAGVVGFAWGLWPGMTSLAGLAVAVSSGWTGKSGLELVSRWAPSLKAEPEHLRQQGASPAKRFAAAASQAIFEPLEYCSLSVHQKTQGWLQERLPMMSSKWKERLASLGGRVAGTAASLPAPLIHAVLEGTAQAALAAGVTYMLLSPRSDT
jgi:hypothetical protein